MPKAKLDNFGLIEEVRNGLSLKLLEMMEVVKNEDDWSEKQIKDFDEHSRNMFLKAFNRLVKQF